MLPTLHTGDRLLVQWGGAVWPGQLVVARPLVRPELLVVKRTRLPLDGADWDVTADNPEVWGRGWTSGPATVLARVLLRYWPAPGLLAGAPYGWSGGPGGGAPSDA